MLRWASMAHGSLPFLGPRQSQGKCVASRSVLKDSGLFQWARIPCCVVVAGHDGISCAMGQQVAYR